MEWFGSVSFDIISLTEIVLKVPATFDHLFFLSLRILWRLYNMSLSKIDALAPLSNNILTVHSLEFQFSSEVPGLIWEFVEILRRGFRDKITPKLLGYKSVALNNCSIFEIDLFLGWLTGQNLIDMWFKLVLIKRSK